MYETKKVVFDDIKFLDLASFGRGLRRDNTLRGFVRVFLDGKHHCDSSNLVVYTGREFVLPRILNISTTQGAADDDYNITIASHFCVGNQGSDVSTGTPTVNPPSEGDDITQLNSIRTYSFAATAAPPKYVDVNNGTETIAAAAKWIRYSKANDADDPNTMRIVTNSTTSRLTEAVLSCKIEAGEPNSTDDYVKIDEAWLMLTIWDQNNYHDITNGIITIKQVFAHVTFAPTWKSVQDGILSIEWHILS